MYERCEKFNKLDENEISCILGFSKPTLKFSFL